MQGGQQNAAVFPDIQLWSMSIGLLCPILVAVVQMQNTWLDRFVLFCCRHTCSESRICILCFVSPFSDDLEDICDLYDTLICVPFIQGASFHMSAYMCCRSLSILIAKRPFFFGFSFRQRGFAEFSEILRLLRTMFKKFLQVNRLKGLFSCRAHH